MLICLLITWLTIPLAPLNPVPQDTVDALNLHFSAGVTSPNGVVSVGPEFSTKLEFRPFHPFIVRAETNVRAGTVGTRIFPDGELHNASYMTGKYQALTTGIDFLAYRGTDHLTAYLGFGGVYGFYSFSPDDDILTDLRNNYGITDVKMQQRAGYRVTIGVRFSKLYSFEIGVTEINPNFLFERQHGNDTWSIQSEQTRFSSFRFTLGYIFPLRQW